MPASKTRHSRPSFPVFMRAEVGAVEMGPGGDLPPALAAFKVIDEHAAANGDDARYEFTLPGGPTFTVEITHGH